MEESTSQRRLAAILCADVAGYSRLMGADEHATLATLTACRVVFSRLTAQFNGRIVNAPGDSILAEFGSVVDAVGASVEIQRELAERNAEEPIGRRMDFRIGVNLGDVLVKDGDLYGDGVNIAARIQALAEPGGISISDTVYNAVRGKLPLEFGFQGEHRVKNIEHPVRMYRVLSKPGAAAHRVVLVRRALRLPRNAAIAGAVVAFVAAAGVAAFLYWRDGRLSGANGELAETNLPLPDKPSIAVLPLTNMSGDAEQEYFSDGISEDIITGLTRFTNLLVIARNSTFQYKGKPVDVRHVGRDLGVRYVLEGSVRRAENRVRITAQLIDATTGAHVWAESYDEESSRLLGIQDEITRQIVGKLGVEVDRAEFERSRLVPPQDMSAHDLVLQARRLIHMESPTDHAKARDLLERAVKLDANYAAAHADLAWIYLDEFRFGYNAGPNPSERALAAARRAIELDPNNGVAHWRLAKIHFYRKEVDQYEAEKTRALKLNSNHAELLADIGIHEMLLDRLQEAYLLYEQAIRLDPNGPPWVHFIPSVYFYEKRQYEKALAEALKINMPGFYRAPYMRAISYAQLGRLDEARAEAAEVLRLKPDFEERRDCSVDKVSWARCAHRAEGAAKAGLPLGRDPGAR